MHRRPSSIGSNPSHSSLTRRTPTRRVSGRSHNQSVTEETLVHWYRSHHHTGAGLHTTANTVLITEESENEYIIEDPRYQFNLFNYPCNPYAKCYMEVKKIREYRHFLQDTLEEVFRTLRWIDLPGGQHRVAVERNYLMNYIWLMSFIVSEVDTTNKDTARHIRFRLEELLVQAENLGILVQSFFNPLQVLAQNHALVEELGELLQSKKVSRPRAEKKILRINIKPDNTMLSGNKVDDFGKLLIYVRKDCQVWTRFRTLTESDKVDIVTKGLMEITDTLKDLKGLIKRPLRAIRAGSGRQLTELTLFLPTLVPHVQQLKIEVKKILKLNRNSLEGDDRALLEAILTEITSHYGYILKFAELLVEEVWDIILMVRMSYTFIRESPQNNVCPASSDAVLISKFRQRKIKKLLKASNFTSEDFYKADCPDTLRKLPVVVVPANAELSLHLQGHRNTHKSKTSTPAHKFSLKRRTSAGLNNRLPAETTKPSTETNKLMFVSEGD